MEMFFNKFLSEKSEKPKNTWVILNNVFLTGILCVVTSMEDIISVMYDTS